MQTMLTLPRDKIHNVLKYQRGKIFSVVTEDKYGKKRKTVGRLGKAQSLNYGIPGVPQAKYFHMFIMGTQRWRTVIIKQITAIRAGGRRYSILTDEEEEK